MYYYELLCVSIYNFIINLYLIQKLMEITTNYKHQYKNINYQMFIHLLNFRLLNYSIIKIQSDH
jgi:hypothetical protein